MYTAFDGNAITDIFYHPSEAKSIGLAVADLQSDLQKVSGQRAVVKQYLPREESGYLAVGSLENGSFRTFVTRLGVDVSAIEGQWEHYLLATVGEQDQNLLICGSDRRGAMWGIYVFCERYLGVDPLYFWTDHEPQPQASLILPSVSIIGGPQTFRFRGLFINDEDLLTEWKDGGGRRYIDYPFYHQVTHQSIIDKVIETALRLRQNMIIPASFADIDNPAEENLIRMATERGLYITQHHTETMGVSHFGFENYWRHRGKDIPASYVNYPQAFEEVWTHYAQKWAQYENVIWQLGLRGRGDRPMWFNDSSVPPSMEARGKLISSALAKQVEIIERALGHKDFVATTTLWMEGSELHEQGYLTFPENVIVVFADHGSTQMMLDDFFHTEREPERAYGVYHHVTFWGAGPHLVEGTSIDKLTYNYGQAVEKGDTAYSILNVANVREAAMGAAAVAAMTWDYRAFDPDTFLSAWMERQFGKEAVEETCALYRQFHAAYHVLDSTLIPGQMLLLDGMVRQRGLKLIRLLEGKMSDGVGRRLGKWGQVYDRANLDSPQAFVAFHKQALAESLERWKAVYGAAYRALPSVLDSRKQYFVDHFVVQIEIIIGLYAWCYHLCLAAETQLSGQDPGLVAKHVNNAAYAMTKLLLDRKKAEHGKWRNWYRGDKKMNLPDVLQKTKAVLDRMADEYDNQD